MPDAVSWLLDTSDYFPRTNCGVWSREMVLLHNVSDGLIWLAYLMIPVLLITFARKRRDLPYPWMFMLFGAFIVGCGFTHFIEVVIFYYPIYRISAVVKVITAAVSLATVAALVPVIPRALTLRSPAELQREIDERVKVEAQLREAARELERSNRELQEFAGVASHDLQEPLRKIQSFGDRLNSRYGPILGEDGRDYLSRMLNASERMSRLIDDLLAFSRVGSQARPFVRVSLGQVAREVAGDLEARISQTGGRVEIGDLPAVVADASQMRQLLQNLIGNGLKFHREGVPPLISISGSVAADGACLLSVKDNGIGFDAKYVDRIFNLFQRLHGRGVYDGTGMGLAICRKIVERHGGAITAESAPGAGSTFLVTLPAAPGEGGAS